MRCPRPPIAMRPADHYDRGRAANGRRQAVGQRKAGGADGDRHDFNQVHDHRAVIACIDAGQSKFDRQMFAETGLINEPRHCRIGGGTAAATRYCRGDGLCEVVGGFSCGWLGPAGQHRGKEGLSPRHAQRRAPTTLHNGSPRDDCVAATAPHQTPLRLARRPPINSFYTASARTRRSAC